MKSILSILIIALAAATLHAVEPVNDKCPVCGKNARLIFHANYQGQRIIFDTSDCMEKFNKSPGGYKVAPKK